MSFEGHYQPKLFYDIPLFFCQCLRSGSHSWASSFNPQVPRPTALQTHCLHWPLRLPARKLKPGLIQFVCEEHGLQLQESLIFRKWRSRLRLPIEAIITWEATQSSLSSTEQPHDGGESLYLLQDTARTDKADQLIHRAGVRAAQCSLDTAASPYSSTNWNLPYIWYKVITCL